MFLLPYYTYAYLVTSLSRTGGKSPLGDTSLLVLLLLVHYGKVKAGEAGEVGAVGGDGRPEYHLNPFRNAVANARDAQRTSLFTFVLCSLMQPGSRRGTTQGKASSLHPFICPSIFLIIQFSIISFFWAVGAQREV